MMVFEAGLLDVEDTLLEGWRFFDFDGVAGASLVVVFFESIYE